MQNYRPVQAFKQYFLDVKPFHTKILEIIEKYKLNEDVSIRIDEKIFFDVVYKNDPLCRTVGYGYIWDGECGFDAVDCCDLFNCIGGFGIAFDNSNLVANYQIDSLISHKDEMILSGDDNVIIPTDIVLVSGNVTHDTRVQIDSIPTYDTIQLIGDLTPYFVYQNIFMVIPIKTLPIISNTETQIIVNGNHANDLINERQFNLTNSGGNDDIYKVISVVYDSLNGTTIIDIATDITSSFHQRIRPNLVGASIEFKIGSRNNGGYLITSTHFDGNVTTLVLHPDTPMAFTNTTEGSNHGSIQLRTGMMAGRNIYLEGTGTEHDGNTFNIIRSEYSIYSNQTTIHLDSEIVESSSTGSIKMYGYMHEGGYDGKGECTTPKHSNVKVGISERLDIIVTGPYS